MTRIHLWHEELNLSAGHDYSPDWDYEVSDLPGGEIGEFLAAAVTRVERDVLPVLAFGEAVVFVVEEESFGECIGKYVNGTSSCPFIGIDAALLWRLAGQAGFMDEAVLTIVHELGHAYLDRMGVDEHGGDDECEEVVEGFARHYLDTGEVDASFMDRLTETLVCRT